MNDKRFIIEETPAKPTGPTPFTLWKPSQFIEYTAPEGAVILGDHLLEFGKWMSILGIGGLGKTRIILYLAICQITGRPWCGLPTKGKPLKWLFLSNENGLERWKTDLVAMLSTLTEADATLVEENLRIMALVDDEDGDLNAGNPLAMARLGATLRVENPGVIIFDPWADMVAGDENKTVDAVTTLRVLRPIVRKEAPKAGVIVIHHGRTGSANVGQAGDNYQAGNFGRGAKALYSAVRAEIQLAPGDRDDPSRIVLACGKNSDGPKFTARGVVFDSETHTYAVDPSFDLDAWRNDVNGKRTDKSVTIADVVGAVKDRVKHVDAEVSMAEIASEIEAIGGTKRSAQRRLKEAIAQKYLREGSKRGFYRLGSKPLAVS